ncbi:MAG: peptidylprolyl isomerase [Thermosynechococcaceae cyanobacterium MS004]|nr:peptidylprolyl isomerase [Thermosynechococcaceae cyanobacterium MS004]
MLTRPIHFLLRPLMAIALVLVLASCTTPGPTDTASAPPEPPVNAAETPPPGAESPAPNTKLAKLMGQATVVLTVKGKPITIEVDGTNAPVTAGNFVDLVKRGVYNGTAFHRVEPGFVVQGGDPLSKEANPSGPLGTGSFVDPATQKPRYIPLEIVPEGATEPVYGKTLKSAGVTQPPKLKHGRGAVAMARSMLPDSASSQFYFALTDAATAPLDGDYAVFGRVVSGLEVIDTIQIGDKIESATVTQGLENLKE